VKCRAFEIVMLPPVRELLAELVRRPSINPMGRTDIAPEQCHEGRVADYLEEQLKSLGVGHHRIQVALGRCNLTATFTPKFPTVHMLWEAHQDTVPVDGMTIAPFGGEIRDGRLYGRGACDVKGGLAAMLSAFGELVNLNPERCAKVTVAFTVDEEHTFLGAIVLMKELQGIDVAIVAEPTGLNIVDAHKGVVRRQLETTGVACHSAGPENGINAIYRMAKLLPHIEAYAAELRARPGDVRLGSGSLSVGTIHGGVSPNTVPDRCIVDLDRRLIPGESPGDAMHDLETYLRHHCEVPFNLLPELFACPPLAATNSGDLTAELGQAIDAVVGRHEVHAVSYGTDASILAQAGVPVVVFGPGDIGDAHTKAESVDLRQVEQAVAVLVKLALGK